MALPSDATTLSDEFVALTTDRYVGAGSLTIRSRDGAGAGDPDRDVWIVVREDTLTQPLIAIAVGSDLTLTDFRTDLTMMAILTPIEPFDDQDPIHPRCMRGLHAS